MKFGNNNQDVEILFVDASIEIMGTTHDQKKNYTPFVFVTDCSIHFQALKYEKVDNNKPSTLCATMDSQNEQNNAQLCHKFILDLGCTEHMVSENIKLDDAHSVSSLVKFRNNGILQAAHVEKLI